MHSIAENFKFEFDGITEHLSEYKNDLTIYDDWVNKLKDNSRQLTDFMFEFKDGSRLFVVKYTARYQCTVCH